MSHAEALEHLRAGRPQAALPLLESEVEHRPTDAGAWFLLGACRHALNELAGAAKAFSRSLLLNPGNAEAHFAHVTVLRAQGHKHAALAASRKALDHLPQNARVLYAMALCQEDLGELDAALAHYDAALGIDPEYADALHNRTLLLVRLGRLEKAEANQRSYVAAHPGSARAHSGLADVLLGLGRFDDALASLAAVEHLSSDDISVQVRRGVALASLRRFAEASNTFAEARARDARAVHDYLQRIVPGADMKLMLSPRNLFFWQCHRAMQRCDWASWDACVEELRRLPADAAEAVEPAVAFIAFHLPLSGAQRHAVAHHIAAGIEARIPALPPPRERHGVRIRLGVLSPDLREHLNAYLLLPLFEMLDRGRFELYAYALAPDDGSEIRARLAASADRFCELHARTDDEATATIRADGVDILLDAGGHTTGGRFDITARRPATIQAAYLGFAGSLGSTRVDYAIADAVIGSDPDEWSEKPIHLPHTYFLYDFRQPVPEIALRRRDYGLPDHAFVYCAFHKAEKISPDAFALWMRILGRTPDSVLWLLALSGAAQRSLRQHAEKLGVDPARLVFAPFDPRPRYLARQRLGDLMLDAIHHSAMTTACDALAAGLPMLSLRGAAAASRAGESLLRAAGLPELVCSDKETFVAEAVRLASDPSRLESYRQRLHARDAPLFDTAGRVREIEAALLSMWEQYRARA